MCAILAFLEENLAVAPKRQTYDSGEQVFYLNSDSSRVKGYGSFIVVLIQWALSGVYKTQYLLRRICTVPVIISTGLNW